MNDYRHQVSGFFENPAEGRSALSALLERRIPRERMLLMADGSATAPATPATESADALKDMLREGAVGAAIGTGIGAVAEVALVAANVSLFVASPLLAPLALMGWGASVGGLLGAAAGADHRERKLATLVSDAIANGHVVLLVETRTPEETAIAREAMQGAVADILEVNLDFAPSPGAGRAAIERPASVR